MKKTIKKLILTIFVLTIFVNNSQAQLSNATRFSGGNFYGGVWVRDNLESKYIKAGDSVYSKFVRVKDSIISNSVKLYDGIVIGQGFINAKIKAPHDGILANGKIKFGDWANSFESYEIYKNTPVVIAYGTADDVSPTLLISNDYGQQFGAKLALYNFSSSEPMITGGNLGSISFSANLTKNDSVLQKDAAIITCESESDWLSEDDESGNLVFKTRKDGYWNEGLRINPDGSLTISNVYQLPATDGMIGYGMATNGNSALYWERFVKLTDTNFYVLTPSKAAKTYQLKGSYLTTEIDPTIYAWAKAATKPSYTYSEVGAQVAGTYYIPSDTTSTLLTKAKARNTYQTINESFITLVNNYTTPNNTDLKKMFNSTTNGAFNAEENTTYFFEWSFSLSSLSATFGTFSVGFLGTAIITSINGTSLAIKSTTGAASIVTISTTSATIVTGSSTSTAGICRVTGKITVTTAGTIIPAFQTSHSAAAVVNAGSYFKITKAGSNTVTTKGDWQ